MRERMTVGELKRYYEGRSTRRILFCTENQSWNKSGSPLKAVLDFPIMKIACNPNIICLKGGNNMLYFERVKYINIDIDKSPLGTILEIVCNNPLLGEEDIRYTLVES